MNLSSEVNFSPNIAPSPILTPQRWVHLWWNMPFQRLPRDGTRISVCHVLIHTSRTTLGDEFLCASSIPHLFSNLAWKHLFFSCLYLLIFQFLSSTAINSTMPVKCNSEMQLYLFCKAALTYHQSEMRSCNWLLILEQVILWEKPHRP